MDWWRPVIDAFDARPAGRGGCWKAHCPLPRHRFGDRSMGLRFRLVEGGTVLLVYCWAGCDKRDVLAARGFKMSNLFEPATQDTPRPRPERVEVYPYRDEERRVLYRAVRWQFRRPDGKLEVEKGKPAKSFSYESPDGPGRWRPTLAGVRRVLYRLPELVENPAWPVLVCEGERHCDRLTDLAASANIRLCATTNYGGAHSYGAEAAGVWRPEYSRALAGRRVVVLPDNDEPGRRHAAFVLGSLILHGAASVRVLDLCHGDDWPEGSDVLDWLGAGRTVEELVDLVRSTGEWKPGWAA